MSDVTVKTTGNLIDELITTSMRCWFAQDIIRDKNRSGEDRLKAADDAQVFNARRNALIRAIDERLGEGEFSNPEKSYA